MLVAEIHGHVVPEAAGNEDYLTSAVFGHLRYVSPSVFWGEFLSRAVGLPASSIELSLLDFLTDCGVRPEKYRLLDVCFWPTGSPLGTPDLVLCFSGADTPPLVLIIEAKLWAGKSGLGEQDQLLRYLQLLGSLDSLGLPLSLQGLKAAVAAVLYLTPRESLPELLETRELCRGESRLWRRLFRAQWQDVAAAADASSHGADRLSRLALQDVSAFLKSRGLEYFCGFKHSLKAPFLPGEGNFYYTPEGFDGFAEVSLAALDASAGNFYTASGQFRGFRHHAVPVTISTKHGGWVR